ncbi:fumarylacetoacetate hydrolase family protein [Ponticoccus sp. SC2-23]|uniref:fumarylacetoacetate hydrolase family protein n=1 Tax=Alexandriicola marinus TaxID=2081710 RepID=UPI000FD8EC5E|nr:fumarylacetoacetate hydrolase family protein [Alexandriicola marinus]MBM1220784.1 fumarylacetoacetate hydrolase family protein [Ponticoccus sp. SC6-9]MBM1225354.1 fumarylacetoacetate hydrolase family protein [Ponticoccus sp. SC6-15]MBM1227537.1 fumarylacetoacetate hydrolase family protein [Ponticoccus sp. SC6-38]MBM1234825.1 fumarylacetoacetate hydrolase family protein [Ponticoccus sp. SC6-45]MBM1238039.1 fumarylacetoacetate hydrolase family protein [Ponticoccus sp. SC6-49]MBM1244328.1 fum
MTAIPARIAAFQAAGEDRLGLVTDEGVIDLDPVTGGRFADLKAIIEAGALEAVIAEAQGWRPDFALDEVRWRIPLSNPEKIICVGVNFPDRNAEYKDGQEAPGKPSLFIRFPRSFVGHGENLVRPPESPQLDYEGEIAIVIGAGGRRIPREAAYDHIAALTLCNEGTIRDWVRHAKFNVTQGKNWDRSGAMGPWLVPFRDPAQLDDVRLETRVNGEVRQEDRTGRMLYDFRYIVNYVSTFTTLVPGDIIVCGTPTGAGARFDPPIWLTPGDVVEVEAEGIGILRNGVEDEPC